MRFKLLIAFLILAVGAGLVAILVQPRELLVIGGTKFSIEKAATPADRAKGLGSRYTIAPDQAMLFIFETDDKHCFWMKDMQFAIDIMWLNADKQIVYIAEGVRPESFPITFCPETSARYVVEVAAGTASRLNIRLGQQLRF